MGSLHFQLSHAELDDVLMAAQQDARDNSPAMNEVLRRFKPLAVRISRMHSSCPHDQADLVNECLRVTVSAVRRHKIGTPGFPNFVKLYMRGAAHRKIRQERRDRSELGDRRLVALGEHVEHDASASDLLAVDDLVIARIGGPWGQGSLANSIRSLTAEQEQLLRMVYVGGLTVKEIAAQLGVTSSAVSQRMATVLRLIKDRMAA